MPLNEMPPEARNATRLVLLLTGVILIVISTYLLIDPAAICVLTGLDEQTTRIFAIAFLIAGTADTTMSLIIFRKKDRR